MKSNILPRVVIAIWVCMQVGQAWAESPPKFRWKRPNYAALAAASTTPIERDAATATPRDAAPMPPARDPDLEALRRMSLDDLPVPAAGGGGQFSLTMQAPAAASERLPAPPAASPRDTDVRFDLTVNNAPAAQVFVQMGVGTAYNILVSPELSGTVSVNLRNVTVPEALEVMRDMFGYDYKMQGHRVLVYPNTVQSRIYRVNYLPGRRQGASDLRVSSSSIALTDTKTGGSASSAASSDAGGAKQAEDSSRVRMTSDTNFWQEVQDSLVAMVGKTGGRSVVLNPAAGVIVVRATPAEQRHVADYLRAVQLTIERQVMLEAKIVDVSLSKDSQTGVNWSLFRGTVGKDMVAIGNVAPGLNLSNGTITAPGVEVTPGTSVMTDTLSRGYYGLAVQATNFTALISFLQTQGDVQVLSSPRIATINNQKAVLKVGSDELFVTGVSTNSTTNGNSTVTTPTLTLQPFFSGISLDVTPQIDDSGTVMLHVHPSVSVVNEKQKTIDLGQLGSYKLPLAASSINETDSIVRVKDGHIVAIGGLMRQAATLDKNGVPVLSDVPVMGAMFGQKTNTTSKRELVILIKPTVIQEDGSGWASNEPATPLINPVR